MSVPGCRRMPLHPRRFFHKSEHCYECNKETSVASNRADAASDLCDRPALSWPGDRAGPAHLSLAGQWQPGARLKRAGDWLGTDRAILDLAEVLPRAALGHSESGNGHA